MDNKTEQAMGPWNELKLKAFIYWPNLHEEDFDDFDGGLENMKKKIQTAYGYSLPQLEREFAQFLKSLGSETKSKRTSELKAKSGGRSASSSSTST